MNGLINYVSCGAFWTGLLVRAPDLLRHRRDPYLRAICAVLGLAGLCFFLGAPPTVGAINRLSGVPNLAAPLTYAAITAYCAASQVLVVHWRGGPGVRRTARRWLLAYLCVLAGIAVTFALGDTPVERRTDLDTYYATTPYIAQMIVLYLVAHLAAVTVTAVSSLRWARRVRGGLRVGLTLMGAGALCGAGYSLAKLVAVAARWSGRDWSALGTTVSPAAAGLGALLTVTGVLAPLVTPRVTRWRRARRTYARLAPLERALDDLLVRRTLRLPRPRLASPAARLVWRQTSIHNALSHLDAYFDRGLFDRTRAFALETTADAQWAEAAAWAAVIVTAVRDEADPGRVPPTHGSGRLLGRVPGPAGLVRIADALAGTAPADPVPDSTPDLAPAPVMPGPPAARSGMPAGTARTGAGSGAV
ncbi:MAB_1171c family putative transporter [Streptomyces sp. M2CJ-2]|uniref:MAB_1171c family putative transporter n=1 Tax=Streptomyces sp. M2CJ-2 TaxID=2803948 RepID=UPI001F1D7C0B|nr:MAB_1171c family putative transporter [Streptomyces sp. M2CJ-2]